MSGRHRRHWAVRTGIGLALIISTLAVPGCAFGDRPSDPTDKATTTPSSSASATFSKGELLSGDGATRRFLPVLRSKPTEVWSVPYDGDAPLRDDPLLLVGGGNVISWTRQGGTVGVTGRSMTDGSTTWVWPADAVEGTITCADSVVEDMIECLVRGENEVELYTIDTRTGDPVGEASIGLTDADSALCADTTTDVVYAWRSQVVKAFARGDHRLLWSATVDADIPLEQRYGGSCAVRGETVLVNSTGGDGLAVMYGKTNGDLQRRWDEAESEFTSLGDVAVFPPPRNGDANARSRLLRPGYNPYYVGFRSVDRYADYAVDPDTQHVQGIASTPSGAVASYERQSGGLMWEVGSSNSEVLAACGGSVIVGARLPYPHEDWALMAVDAVTGHVQWSVPRTDDSEYLSDSAEGNGCTASEVIVPTNKSLSAYRLRDGSLSWTIDNTSIDDTEVSTWHIVDGELFLRVGNTLSLWR